MRGGKGRGGRYRNGMAPDIFHKSAPMPQCVTMSYFVKLESYIVDFSSTFVYDTPEFICGRQLAKI